MSDGNENCKGAPMPNPDLLPCPFCGSEDLSERGTHPHKFIMCEDCRTLGPDGVNAAEAWNRRAEG